MPTTSPLPGLIQAPPRAPSPHPAARGSLRLWLQRSIALESADTPGRIAIVASILAATFALGDLALGTGLLALFPYRLARLLLYGASLLSGSIIAAGFLSQARSARFTAILTTSIIV